MIGILLAAGRGTRMKSETPKVLFPICGEPMSMAPLRALMDTCEKVVVVVGYKADEVQSALAAFTKAEFGSVDKLVFAHQKEQNGTGDAIKAAVSEFVAEDDDALCVLNGDLPLVRTSLLKKSLKEFESRKLSSMCLSSLVREPNGLGRIVRDARGVLERICEEADASSEEKKIKEVNSGIYFFRHGFLKKGLGLLKSDNNQGEFYLTDLLGTKADSKRASDAFLIKDEDVEDLAGVNSTYELAHADKIAQQRWKKALAESFGVRFLGDAYIERSVKFSGSSQVLGPGVYIQNGTQLGDKVVIDGNVLISNSQIANNAHIKWGSVITDSIVGPSAQVGPMAHLRPGSELGENTKVGNFVELKKTKMNKGSKASHLSYLGDAEVGEDSNIGCGTITCNYDGVNKHQTVIGKNVFVGSDSQLVAPVKVEDDAYIASGTTVTKDVPRDSLAIARTKMEIKSGYASKLRAKQKTKG